MKTNYITKLITCAFAAATILFTNQSNAQGPWFVAKPGPQFSPKTVEATDVTYSNGYIYAVGTQYNTAGHLDLFVSKTDLGGTVAATTTKDYHAGDDIPVKIKTDGAGNLYVLSTATYNSGDKDVWLAKFDVNLNMTWSTFYHFADEVAVDMLINGSNIYVIANTISAAKGSDIAVLKFTTSGGVPTSTKFSFATTSDNEVAKEITTDGTYMYICGYRDSAATGRDGVILKYNSTLALQWSQAWSPSTALSNEAFNSLVINGSNIFVGGSGWSLSTKNDFLLAKFNKSTGAYVSKVTTNSTTSNDEIRKVCTFGTDVYVTGISEYSTSPVKNKVVTSKFSTSLVQAASWPIVFKPLNDNYECNAMKVNNYGSIAIAGTVKKTSTSGIVYTASFTLIYTAAAVKIQEFITLNSTGCNTVESTGNAIVFTDPNYDYNVAVAGGNKAWISTIDYISANRIEITSTLLRPAGDDSNEPITQGKNGNTEIIQPETEFNAFPNPAFNDLQLTGEEIITGYTVMNMDGKMLKSEVTNQNEVTVDISKLAPGSYLITILSETGKTTKRFIKM